MSPTPRTFAAPSFDLERLYALVPSVYRLRDAERGFPLKALLAVIAREAAVLEEDLAQFYDDQFIETCAPWVVAYIGELLGVRSPSTLSGAAQPRTQVARAIALRRRKGTAAALEEVASDATGCPARVIEHFELLAWTQNLNHLRPSRTATSDLRDARALARTNTPFDQSPRCVDIRRASSARGKHNIPSIAIHLWRLRSMPITAVEPPALDASEGRYRFDPRNADIPLFISPESESSLDHLAQELNVPMPLSRRLLHLDPATYFGQGRSISITIDASPLRPADILVADLSGPPSGPWGVGAPTTKTLIDPQLGRFLLPPLLRGRAVRVGFAFGAAADLGGGTYTRVQSPLQGEEPESPLATLAPTQTLQSALSGLTTDSLVELPDHRTDTSWSSLHAAPASVIVVRSAQAKRPILRAAGEVQISGPDAHITLDGLWIEAAPLRVVLLSGAAPRLIRLRNLTLSPTSPLALSIEAPGVRVEIDRCILGALALHPESECFIRDSVVDAGSPTVAAIGPTAGSAFAGSLHLERSTIVGRVAARSLHASDTIFFAESPAPNSPSLQVERVQEGFVRFSWLPPGSRVPRAYRCLPESGASANAIRPVFHSSNFASPTYAQLSPACNPAFRTGASDAGEIGALNRLQLTHRLREGAFRIEEFVRFGMDAGIFFAS